MPSSTFPNPMEELYQIREEFRTTKDQKRKLELALQMAEYEPETMRPVVTYLDPTCVEAAPAITLKVGDVEFHPDVAYAIFPADFIRGYEDPEVLIEFDSVSLLILVEFKYAAKVDESAPDVLELLQRVLPKDTVYENRAEWERKISEESRNGLQNGTNLQDGKHKVYKLNFKNNAAYLHRMFVFSLFFIEGATLPDEDENWDVYAVTSSANDTFMGYMSVYAFGYFINSHIFDTEGLQARLLRQRIAQVVILPPFQRQQLASRLYTYVLRLLVGQHQVKEIEVEDPSIEFDILRDRANYEWLKSDPKAQPLLEEYADKPEEVIEKLFDYCKLGEVQIQRVAEMYFYVESGLKESKELKRMIKRRLWNANYETLPEMDVSEQKFNLDKLYKNALRDIRVCLRLEKPQESDDEDEGESGSEDDVDNLAALLGNELKRQKTE